MGGLDLVGLLALVSLTWLGGLVLGGLSFWLVQGWLDRAGRWPRMGSGQ